MNSQRDLTKALRRVGRKIISMKGFIQVPNNKRAVFDFVGKIEKELFGTGLNSDILANKYRINSLNRKTSEYLNIAHELKSIVKLHSLEIGQILEQQMILQKFSERISTSIETLYSVQKLKEKSYIKYVTIEAIKDTKSTLAEIIHDIEETTSNLAAEIIEARQGKLSPMLLNPVEMMNIIKKKGTLTHLDKIVHFPNIRSGKELEELYNAVKVKTKYADDKIIIAIEIPLIDSRTTAELYRINSVEIPITPNSERRAKIELSTELLARYKKGEMVNIPQNTLDKCRKLNGYYFCEEEVTKLTKPKEARCAEGLIDNKIPTDEIECDISFHDDEQELELIGIAENIYIYSCGIDTSLETECLTNKNISLMDKVEKGIEKTSHALDRKGLIKIPDTCSVSLQNVKIARKLRESVIKNISYDLPLIRRESDRRVLNNPIWSELIKRIKLDKTNLEKTHYELSETMRRKEYNSEKDVVESKLELKKLEEYIKMADEENYENPIEDTKYIHTITNTVIGVIILMIIIAIIKYQSIMKKKVKQLISSTKLSNILNPMKPPRTRNTTNEKETFLGSIATGLE